MAAGKEHASDFEKIIHEARDRKKNEALAAKIFGRDRRSSTPQQKAPSLGGSLAGRVGVKKRGASTGPRGAPTAPRAAYAGNIDGDWTHDLHERHSAPSTPRPTPPANTSLASRITNPNAGPASRVRTDPRRTAQVAQALIRTELSGASPAGRAPPAATQRNSSSSPWPKSSSNKGGGLTIRGLAGPFVVMAQNFAPGTTAADIESAVTPVGGLVQSCRLLKTEPIVIAEIVFESKEGADRVIETFDNQTADGRLIHVYYKAGGGSTSAAARGAPANAPSGPRAHNRDTVVDGSLGFEDPMDTDRGYVLDTGRARQDPRPQNGLYSDNLVQSGSQQRGGRGYGRGRRGGPGR